MLSFPFAVRPLTDYIGIWNERPWGTPDYVKRLRAALDEAGFTSTTIVGSDGSIPDDQIAALRADPGFSAAEPILGRSELFPWA